MHTSASGMSQCQYPISTNGNININIDNNNNNNNLLTSTQSVSSSSQAISTLMPISLAPILQTNNKIAQPVAILQLATVLPAVHSKTR